MKPTEQEGFHFPQIYQRHMEETPAMPLKKLGGSAIPVLGLTRGPSPTPPRQLVQTSAPQTPSTPVSVAPSELQAVNPPQWPTSFASTSVSGQPLIQAGTSLVRSLLGAIPRPRLEVPFIPQQVNLRHPQGNLNVRLPVTAPLCFPPGSGPGQVRMPNMTTNVQHHPIQTNRFSQPPPTVPLQGQPIPGVLPIRHQQMPVRPPPPISLASQTLQSLTVPPPVGPAQSFVRQQFQPVHTQGHPPMNPSYPAPPPQGNSSNYRFPPVRTPLRMPPRPPLQGVPGVQVLGQPNQRLPVPHPGLPNRHPLQRPMFNPNQPPPGQPHLNQPNPNHPPRFQPHLNQPPLRQPNPNQPLPTSPMNIRPISNLSQIPTTNQPSSHEPKKSSHVADWFADMFAPKPAQKQRDSPLPHESTPESGPASQEKQSYSREQTPDPQSSLWSIAFDRGGGGGTPSSSQGNSTPTNTQGSFLGESSRDVHAGEAVQPGNDIKTQHSPSRRVVLVSDGSPEPISSNFSSSPSPGQPPKEKLNKKPLDDLSKEREMILNALQNLVSSTSDSEEGQETVKREVFLPQKQTKNDSVVLRTIDHRKRAEEPSQIKSTENNTGIGQPLDGTFEKGRSRDHIPDKSWDAASYRTEDFSAERHGSRDSSLERDREIRDCSTERQDSRGSSRNRETVDISPEKAGSRDSLRNRGTKGFFPEEPELRDLSRNRGMTDLSLERTKSRDNSLDRRSIGFSPSRPASRESSGMRDNYIGKPELRESMQDIRTRGYSPERPNSRDSSRNRGTRDFSTHGSTDFSERPGSRNSSRNSERTRDKSSWDAASYRKSQDYPSESVWSRDHSTESGQSIDSDDKSWDATNYRKSRDHSADGGWSENRTLDKVRTRERSAERERSTEYSDSGSTSSTYGSRSRDSSTDWSGRSRDRVRNGRSSDRRSKDRRSRSRSSSSGRYRRPRDYSEDRYRRSRNYSPRRYRDSRDDSPDRYRRSRYHSPDRYRRSQDYTHDRFRTSKNYSPDRYRGSRDYSPDDYKRSYPEDKSRNSKALLNAHNIGSRGAADLNRGSTNLSTTQMRKSKDHSADHQNEPSINYPVTQNRNFNDYSADQNRGPWDLPAKQNRGAKDYSDNQRRASRQFSAERNRTSFEHERQTTFCPDNKDPNADGLRSFSNMQSANIDVRRVEVDTSSRKRPQAEYSRQAFVVDNNQPYQTLSTSENIRRVIRATGTRDTDSPTRLFKQSTDYHEDLAAELRRCSGEKVDATDTPDDYSSISGDSLEDLEDLNSNLVSGNKTSKEPGPRMPLTIESYLKFKLGVEEPDKVKERILWPLDTDLMVQSKNKRRRMVQKAKVVAAHYLKKLKTMEGMGCDSSTENNAETMQSSQEPAEMKLEDFSKDQILMELQIVQECIKKCDELRKLQGGGGPSALGGNIQGAAMSVGGASTSTGGALGNININLPGHMLRAVPGPSNSHAESPFPNPLHKTESAVKPPDRDLNRQRDALHQVSCDLMEAFQKLSFIGRPHQKIPEDILLKNEKNKYHSEEGCFLILLSAVSTKPHSRLLAMRKELERLHKMLLQAATMNKTQDVAMIQKKVKSLHSDRKKLMTTFTGSLGKKRLRKLNLVRTKYQVCMAYLKKELGVEEMRRLQYIAALHRSINTHIRIVHKELISPTL